MWLSTFQSLEDLWNVPHFRVSLLWELVHRACCRCRGKELHSRHRHKRQKALVYLCTCVLTSGSTHPETWKPMSSSEGVDDTDRRTELHLKLKYITCIVFHVAVVIIDYHICIISLYAPWMSWFEAIWMPVNRGLGIATCDSDSFLYLPHLWAILYVCAYTWYVITYILSRLHTHN